jgi:hypothetical protein
MINSISSVGHNQGASRTQQPRVNLPPFMLSKSKPKMSDEEFEKKIIELAKRDQAAGRFYSKDDYFKTLQNSFISVASPDREGMINNALPSILNKIREYANTSTAKSYNSYEEMLMHLLYGIEPPNTHNYNPGQSIVLFELKDANGNLLAMLTTSGWSIFGTPAENAREMEFNSIYVNAWRVAEHESKYGTAESRLPDGWAMGSETALSSIGITSNMTAETITTVDISDLQPQQAQAAKTSARYEANLHEVTA